MSAVIRIFTKVSFVIAMATLRVSAPALPTAVPQSKGATANVFYPEVRLRKLHLVRPDLIPYPIFYDVYC